MQVLQFEYDLCLQVENRALQRRVIGAGLTLIHAEKFKVTTEVEDIELVFILAVKQIFA